MTDYAYTSARRMQGAGDSIGRSLVRSSNHANNYSVTIPAATALTNWVKTDDDTGTADEPAGFTAGTYDVYWSGGRRYGVDATVVGTSSTIQLDGGSGDAYPVSGTSMVINEQVQIKTDIDGDNIIILGMELQFDDPDSTALGHIDMQDSGAATVYQTDLNANDMLEWDIEGGDTNDFTGNPITDSYVTHDDTANSAIFKILSLEDRTP